MMASDDFVSAMRPDLQEETIWSDSAIKDEGDFEEDHKLLRAATREAGLLTLDYFGQSPRQWEKEPRHVVSEADIAVDGLLQERLLTARPDYAWLSEESPVKGNPAQAARIWIIDPIDGTRAFLQQRPEYAVSVALVEAGRPIFAAVFNPRTDEFFEACSGRGAWMNGQRLAVGAAQTLEGSRLLVSYREFNDLVKANEVKGCEVRSVSSIAYKMCLVAAGRGDLALSMFQKNDWDIAAAHLILEEAGGRASLADGRSLMYGDAKRPHPSILAANPVLHGLVSRQYANV